MLLMTIGIKNNKVLSNYGASNGEDCPKQMFLSKDVKIDSLLEVFFLSRIINI